MIDETTAITIFMKCKVRISRVILRTLKALRILTALSAERLPPPPVPKAISTMLVLTTKASKRFMISAKKLIPYTKILSTRSTVKI